MASTIKVDKIEGSTGSTITVPTGQTFTITDGLAVSGGGTGLASFTAGDILYATGSTTLAKLAKGTAEQVLAMNSGASAPDWGSVDLTVLPTISVAKGGTNIASFTAGDILYATGATTLAKLAAGTGSDTLKMNSGGTAPEWVTVAPATSDYVKLGTGTVSAAASLSIDGLFTTDYQYYVYYVRGLYGSSSGQSIYVQFNTSAGTPQTGSSYKGAQSGSYYNNAGSSGTQKSGGWNSSQILVQNISSSSSELGYGTIYVFDPLTAGTRTCLTSVLGGMESNYLYVKTSAGFYDAAEAHTGITISPGSGTITIADVTVYGAK